ETVAQTSSTKQSFISGFINRTIMKIIRKDASALLLCFRCFGICFLFILARYYHIGLKDQNFILKRSMIYFIYNPSYYDIPKKPLKKLNYFDIYIKVSKNSLHPHM
ncbi:hypothetical protein ACJX0J_012973, partial [Zea mays]